MSLIVWLKNHYFQTFYNFLPLPIIQVSKFYEPHTPMHKRVRDCDTHALRDVLNKFQNLFSKDLEAQIIIKQNKPERQRIHKLFRQYMDQQQRRIHQQSDEN